MENIDYTLRDAKDVVPKVVQRLGRKNQAAGNFDQMPGACQEFVDWLTHAGYDKIALLGAGGQSLAFKTDNPDLVLRVAPWAGRLVIPSMCQPINWHESDEIFLGSTNAIELMPALGKIHARIPELQQQFLRQAKLYYPDIIIDPTHFDKDGYKEGKFTDDIGMFNHGGFNVPMAIDGGLFFRAGGHIIVPGRYKRLPSLCTKDYPPLDIQGLLHQDMVVCDDRLGRLIRTVRKFPETQLVDPVESPTEPALTADAGHTGNVQNQRKAKKSFWFGK